MQVVVFVYLGMVALFYGALVVLAYRPIRRQQMLKIDDVGTVIPVSIIVPAHNEQAGIVNNVRSMLSDLNYGRYEIIIVNDGSTDDTIKTLTNEFQFVEDTSKKKVHSHSLATQPIVKRYRSLCFPHLFLIDKERGGKADSLNAGINAAQYHYFAAIDGDTVLDRDALSYVMQPILISKSPHNVVACGGTLLVANPRKNSLVVMQLLEYFRAFFVGRVASSRLNMYVLVSGAFGVFQKEAVLRVGGYATATVGEDMELTIRLHRKLKEAQRQAQIVTVPHAVGYTEVPDRWQTIMNQRLRWFEGMAECLWLHRAVIFRPKYGLVGMVALPYFLLVEMLGSIVEFSGYVVLLGLWVTKSEWLPQALTIFGWFVLYHMLLTLVAILYKQWTLNTMVRIKEWMYLLFFVATEAIWFRPLMSFVRLWGLLHVLRGKKYGWGEMKRKDLSK